MAGDDLLQIGMHRVIFGSFAMAFEHKRKLQSQLSQKQHGCLHHHCEGALKLLIPMRSVKFMVFPGRCLDKERKKKLSKKNSVREMARYFKDKRQDVHKGALHARTCVPRS